MCTLGQHYGLRPVDDKRTLRELKIVSPLMNRRTFVEYALNAKTLSSYALCDTDCLR